MMNCPPPGPAADRGSIRSSAIWPSTDSAIKAVVLGVTLTPLMGG